MQTRFGTFSNNAGDGSFLWVLLGMGVAELRARQLHAPTHQVGHLAICIQSWSGRMPRHCPPGKIYRSAAASGTSAVEEIGEHLHNQYCQSFKCCYCSAGNDCDLASLQMAHSLSDIYSLSIAVTENATKLSRECTARPCYLASVHVKVPRDGCAEPWSIHANINENQYFE